MYAFFMLFGLAAVWMQIRILRSNGRGAWAGYTIATALLLCGEPIDEPIVGYGPFVMNSPQEIRQAIADYQSGKMGHLS